MVDGVVVAMGVIIARVKKLKFTKRIWLITDGGSEIAVYLDKSYAHNCQWR